MWTNVVKDGMKDTCEGARQGRVGYEYLSRLVGLSHPPGGGGGSTRIVARLVDAELPGCNAV
jgi:hypothetical protein